MSNIALIPARSCSKRIPGKNLMDFCGKPLFMWSVEQARSSNLIDRVIVSTDMNVVGDYETLVRPNSLCTDATTQEEVIAHAIETLQLKDDDNVILLQPTSPLRLPGDIDRCIEKCFLTHYGKEKNFYNVFSSHREKDIFLWSNSIQPVTFNPVTRHLLNGDYFYENGSIYVIPVKNFNKHFSRYSPLQLTYKMYKWQQFELDTPEDIEMCEYFMDEKIIRRG